MVDKHRRLGYCKAKRIQMITSLRFLFVGMLATVLALLMLSTELTYKVAVHSTMNRALTPQLLIYKDLMSARPIHRRPTAGVINHITLLSYAAIELGELDERQQINRLLDRNIGSEARPMSSWSTATQKNRPQRREVLLARRYAAHWTEFCRALRSWVQNKRFDPRVMAELGDLVKNPLDRHYNATGALQIRPGQPYRSCAVVGNSGILLNKTRGPLIDSHEMVIRLNNARTSGFEGSVGSKTSLSFINSNILHLCAWRSGCFCHPYGENVPVLMYICQAAHFMDFTLCNASLRTPLLVTDARFDKLCARVVKYYSLKNFVETTGKHPDEWSAAHEGAMFHYSSGMQAVMLALGICEKVSLFGFGKSPEAKHHYHTPQKSELPLHDYEAEYQLYHDLAHRSQDIPFLSEAGIKLPPLQIYL